MGRLVIVFFVVALIACCEARSIDKGERKARVARRLKQAGGGGVQGPKEAPLSSKFIVQAWDPDVLCRADSLSRKRRDPVTLEYMCLKDWSVWVMSAEEQVEFFAEARTHGQNRTGTFTSAKSYPMGRCIDMDIASNETTVACHQDSLQRHRILPVRYSTNFPVSYQVKSVKPLVLHFVLPPADQRKEAEIRLEEPIETYKAATYVKGVLLGVETMMQSVVDTFALGFPQLMDSVWKSLSPTERDLIARGGGMGDKARDNLVGSHVPKAVESLLAQDFTDHVKKTLEDATSSAMTSLRLTRALAARVALQWKTKAASRATMKRLVHLANEQKRAIISIVNRVQFDELQPVVADWLLSHSKLRAHQISAQGHTHNKK